MNAVVVGTLRHLTLQPHMCVTVKGGSSSFNESGVGGKCLYNSQQNSPVNSE